LSNKGLFVSKVEYVSISDTSTTIELNDVKSFTTNKSTEIKNNLLNLNLKNLPNRYDGKFIYGDYVNDSYDITFQEGDQLKIYFKMTDDPSDFNNSSNWVSDSTLAGTFVLNEFNMRQEVDSSMLTLKATDSAYIMFNKVWTYDYGNGTWTMPGCFRHIVRNACENTYTSINSFTGTNNDEGVEYGVDAKFLSEGGFIQDYRTVSEGGPSTQLNGAINDSVTTITVDSTTGFKDNGTIVITDGTNSEHISYTGLTSTTFTGCVRAIDDTKEISHIDNTNVYQGFPVVGIYKIWKALFEWFGELISTDQTNYEDEIVAGGTPFYNRSFLFYVDAQNKMHLMPADDTVGATIELGDDDFKGFNLTKSVFDSVNFVIYSCGEDMYGNGILWYYYNDSSNIGSLKMKYQPLTDISNTLIQSDLKINSTRETTNQDTYRQFPDSAEYPISTWGFKQQQNAWENLTNDTITTSITSDADYNDGLRKACRWQGWNRAKNITLRTAGLRYRGQVAVDGQIYNPGDLIQVVNKYTGLLSQKLRVINVYNNGNSNNVRTTLDVEEDEQVLG